MSPSLRTLPTYVKSVLALDRERISQGGQYQHSRAMANYLRFWFASKPSTKRRFAKESWSHAKKAMTHFNKDRDPISFAQTFEFFSVLVPVLVSFEWNASARAALYDETLEYGRHAIESLPATAKGSETLVKTYVRVALFIDALREERGVTEGQEMVDREGKDYWRRAIRINRKLALETLPRPPEGFYHILDNDESLPIWQDALELARRHRDKFAMAWLFDQLAGRTFWDAVGAEDTKQCKKLSKRSLDLAEKAGRLYDSFNYTTPSASVMWPHSPYAEHFMQLSWFELDQDKRRLLLMKSISEANDLLRIANHSLYPKPQAYANHIASKARMELAELETNPIKKKNLVLSAVDHRKTACSIIDKTQPSSLWARGVYMTNLAHCEFGLAGLEQNPRSRRLLLLEGIKTYQAALRLCTKFIESIKWGKTRPLHGAMGAYYASYGKNLIETHEILGGKKHLSAAANAFANAARWTRKAMSQQRGTAAYCWMAGRTHDRLRNYSSAANEFAEASRIYRAIAPKVALRAFYEDRAKYLMVWTKIEQARGCHTRFEYIQAHRFYIQAAEICKSTTRWSFLATYLTAIGNLETGENLSRLGDPSKAIQAFRQASTLFQDSTRSLRIMKPTQERSDEQALIEGLANERITEYCDARTLIERAKACGNQGDHREASAKFREASETLKEISGGFQSRDSRRDLLFIASLSRGWELMALSLEEHSDRLLKLAEEGFEKTSGFATTRNSRLLAVAYAQLCRGTVARNNFMKNFNSKDYSIATRALATAENYFLESGFTAAYEQAKGTRRFLDAQLQMWNSTQEEDQAKRTAYIDRARILMREAAEAFSGARQTKSSNDILVLIDKIDKERMRSSNLPELSSVRTSLLAAVGFPSPANWGGNAVEPAALSGADVEVGLKVDLIEDGSRKAVRAVIGITNAGSRPVRIVSVDDVIPEGSQLLQAPGFLKIQGRSLLGNGRQIEPSKNEDLLLVFKQGSNGFVFLKPRIRFLNASGRLFQCDLPSKIVINSPILEYLSEEFNADYSERRLAPLHAGWRTLMDVVRGSNISRSQAYGDPRYGHRFGKQLEALLQSGIVESRIFPGERGRGGQILKVRLSMNNDVGRQLAETSQASNANNERSGTMDS